MKPCPDAAGPSPDECDENTADRAEGQQEQVSAATCDDHRARLGGGHGLRAVPAATLFADVLHSLDDLPLDLCAIQLRFSSTLLDVLDDGPRKILTLRNHHTRQNLGLFCLGQSLDPLGEIHHL